MFMISNFSAPKSIRYPRARGSSVALKPVSRLRPSLAATLESSTPQLAGTTSGSSLTSGFRMEM